VEKEELDKQLVELKDEIAKDYKAEICRQATIITEEKVHTVTCRIDTLKELVEAELPQLAKWIDDVKEVVSVNDDRFIEVTKHLADEVKRGFDQLECVRRRTVRERSDLQVEIRQVRERLEEIKDHDAELMAQIERDRGILGKMLKANELQFALEQQNEADKRNMRLLGVTEE